MNAVNSDAVAPAVGEPPFEHVPTIPLLASMRARTARLGMITDEAQREVLRTRLRELLAGVRSGAIVVGDDAEFDQVFCTLIERDPMAIDRRQLEFDTRFDRSASLTLGPENDF